MGQENIVIEKTKEPGIVRRIGPRGTSYTVTLSIGSHADGSRKQLRRSFPTFDAAKAFKVKTHHERRSGSYIVPTRERLGDYLDRWCDGLRGQIKTNSLFVYRQCISRLSMLHDVPLVDLSTATLHRTQQSMVAAGLAKSSISLTFKVFRIAIGNAVSDRLLSINPFIGFKTVTIPRYQPKRLTSEEVLIFLDSIDEDPHRVLWELAFETGMRFAEMASLRWTEVDLDSHQIIVNRTLTRTEKGAITEGTPKSDAGVRTIAVSSQLATLLANHRDEVSRQAALNPGWNPLGLVFPAESATYLNNTVVNDWLKAACTHANVTTITIHGMRHTSGSEQAASGIPIKTVTQRLGHSNVSTTLQLYVHPDAAAHRQAADLISDRLRRRNDKTVTTLATDDAKTAEP